MNNKKETPAMLQKNKNPAMLKTNKNTIKLLDCLAEKYQLGRLKEIIKDEDSVLFSKDIYISLDGIVRAVELEEDTLKELRNAKNIYGSNIFAVNKEEFLIKNKPDFEKANDDMEKYLFCFKLSPYHIINTYLAIVEAQITGFNLDELIKKATHHIETGLSSASQGEETVDPLLIIPVGTAGSGKSTFYHQIPDVVNISCDNIRYLLFKDYGPCFSSWESCLSWWVVNYLTDSYISKGYDIFYNGVNTDMEYRSPITMEDSSPLFAGIPYNVRMVYFEPAVKLSSDELKELKDVNLWETPIEELELTRFSDNVSQILQMIKNNYTRTLSRTKDIAEGRKVQDPYDVLYAVPAAVIKLFVEQSFDRPHGDNVIVIPRKELPDEEERAAFYREYALKAIQRDLGHTE